MTTEPTSRPSAIRAFNNGGFDVVRFGRDPSGDYADWAQDWLRQGLTELRRQGYRFVVSSGQSRGANDALFMLGSAGVVDAGDRFVPWELRRGVFSGILALAPRGGHTHRPGWYSPSSSTILYGGPDLAGRAELVRRTLRPAVAGSAVDRSASLASMATSAARSADFAIKFGDCIYRFAIGQPASCGPAAQIFNR